MSQRSPRKFKRIDLERLVLAGENIPTIAYHLGVSTTSVREWCETFGFPRPARVRARSKKGRAQLISLFEEGLSITQIARRVPCCRQTVINILKDEQLYSPRQSLPKWARGTVKELILALEDYIQGVPAKKAHYDLARRATQLDPEDHYPESGPARGAS